ncbi:UNVERIFIED_CONTAM: hypothetical protein K2H54_036646 [Gekko kuhli]
MKIFSFLSAFLFLMLLAAPAFAHDPKPPKNTTECHRAGGKCELLRCPENYHKIGMCDIRTHVCCRRSK